MVNQNIKFEIDKNGYAGSSRPEKDGTVCIFTENSSAARQADISIPQNPLIKEKVGLKIEYNEVSGSFMFSNFAPLSKSYLRIKGPYILKNDDSIKIGENDFLTVVIEQDNSCLVGENIQSPLNKEKISIGRDKSRKLILASPSISNRHCK